MIFFFIKMYIIFNYINLFLFQSFNLQLGIPGCGTPTRKCYSPYSLCSFFFHFVFLASWRFWVTQGLFKITFKKYAFSILENDVIYHVSQKEENLFFFFFSDILKKNVCWILTKLNAINVWNALNFSNLLYKYWTKLLYTIENINFI